MGMADDRATSVVTAATCASTAARTVPVAATSVWTRASAASFAVTRTAFAAAAAEAAAAVVLTYPTCEVISSRPFWKMPLFSTTARDGLKGVWRSNSSAPSPMRDRISVAMTPTGSSQLPMPGVSASLPRSSSLGSANAVSMSLVDLVWMASTILVCSFLAGTFLAVKSARGESGISLQSVVCGQDSSPAQCMFRVLCVQAFRARDVGGQIVGDIGPSSDDRGVAHDGEVSDVLTATGERQGDTLAHTGEFKFDVRRVCERLPGPEDVLLRAVLGLRRDQVRDALQQII